jgi:hypothetical protein
MLIAALSPLLRVAEAQIIAVRTVPLAQGDQFAFLPSANLGMAGVSIALPDTMLDPFSNPARSALVRRTTFFGSPSVYTVTAGGGRTFPVGSLFRSGAWHGALALAIQEVSPSHTFNSGGFFPGGIAEASTIPGATIPSSEPQTNRYAAAVLGRTFAARGLTVAASAFWSGLRAVDGTDLYYPGSEAVLQHGDALDLRFGAMKQLGNDRSLEAVMVHNRFGLNHDAHFMEFVWDPGSRTSIPRDHQELGGQRSRVMALQLKYEQPISDSGWRAGALFTANRGYQPQVPANALMNVPLDPGHNTAFNVGAGVSKASRRGRFGIDAIYEPAWERTVGASSVNRFRFSNAILRSGVSHDVPLDAYSSFVRFQFGMQLHAISYTLDQWGPAGLRIQNRSWNEWTHSWGTSLLFPDLQIHYQGRLLTGMGRPGANGIVFATSIDPFFPNPTATTQAMQGVKVMTHQFSFSLPMP